MSRAGLFRAALLLALAACGGEAAQRREQPKSETSLDAVLRIGSRWEARTQARGLRSPPSRVASYEVTETSELTIRENGTVHEALRIDERVELRDGLPLRCSTKVEHDLRARFGKRAGEPAVALTRPTVTVPRRCVPGSHPDGPLQLEGEARFVLASDTLKPFAPVTERRTYLPLE